MNDRISKEELAQMLAAGDVTKDTWKLLTEPERLDLLKLKSDPAIDLAKGFMGGALKGTKGGPGTLQRFGGQGADGLPPANMAKEVISRFAKGFKDGYNRVGQGATQATGRVKAGFEDIAEQVQRGVQNNFRGRAHIDPKHTLGRSKPSYEDVAERVTQGGVKDLGQRVSRRVAGPKLGPGGDEAYAKWTAETDALVPEGSLSTLMAALARALAKDAKRRTP